MTESPDTTQEAEASPAPVPAETPEEKTQKEATAKPGGLPVGQIAVGGLGATVLGSAALASAVGPLGWLAAPAVATAGGVGYVAYKTRKRRGRRSSSGRSQQTKTTTTRTTGGGSRLGSSGMAGGRGRTASTASRSAGVGAAPRRAGGGAAGSARPSGGSSSRPGGRSGGSSPRVGSSPRGAAPRGSSRGTTPRGSTPRGGGLFGRSGDTSSKKRSGRPSSGGGTSTTPRGGSMTKSRWGGSSGPTTAPGGRMKRAARAARDWADDKTGRKASSAFKAARKERGFFARSKAASRAVRKKGGGRVISGIVGVIVAAFTGLASLFGGSKKTKATADTPADAKGGYKLGPEVPGHPGVHYADPRDTRPGYVDRRGLGPDHPGYANDDYSYDANIDPRTWDERVAAGDVPGFSPKTTAHTGGTTMAGSRTLPHAQHAADMLASVTRYEPEDLFVVIDQARQWPDMVRDTAMAVRTYVQVLQANRFPLQNGSIDALQDLFNALIKVMPAAEAIHPQMCRDHAPDLERANYGRGDERRANVS